MTVCIAAIPQFTDSIVLVSDQLLSSDNASVDGAIKVTVLAPGTDWYIMFAGDPAKFLSLMGRMPEVFGDVRNTRLTLDMVAAAFEQAYALELLKLVETEILMPYGLSRDDFIRNGKTWLGDRFSSIFDQISNASLDLEIMVAGLDAEAKTRLFSVSPRGVATRAILPYHAIGSGAFVALGTLFHLSTFPTHDLSETIYRLCAAKFAAENLPSVGPTTYVLVISPLTRKWTLIDDIDRIRELWKSKGQPPVPSAAVRMIEKNLRRISHETYK